MEGSNYKEPEKCAGCLNNIGEEEYVSALGQEWHKDCFRCSVCDAALSSWYFEKNGMLFCQPDYWTRYGECCQQCTEVITGPVMAAGSHRFHPECFACGQCGAPIEDAEPYALVERTRLYCGGCYSATGGSHSIRVVTVPSSALRVEPAPANTLTVTEYDSSCGVVALHIGDRILEINGAPPRAAALDVRPPALLQLTIEHNPDTTRNRKITCNILTDRQANTEIKTPEENQKTSIDHNTKDQKISIENTVYNSTDQKTGIDQKTLDKTEELERDGKRERLFKRKGEDGGKTRVMKRRQTPASPLLGDKERSSSMSKLLDVSDSAEDSSDVLCELSRARSFRAEPEPQQKVFRASDLIQGELLGSGFFGEVYKVTHRASGDVMVLKQLYRVDDDAQRNFLKEVAVLRSLSHPNVLRFVGVVYKDKRLHLVTEYVAGGTLHQLIQDSSITLGWGARARLARDVAAGLGYLHRRNVIHRDLNSHNCLVRADRGVVVADFGLARLVRRTASSTTQRAAHHTLRRKRYTVVGNPYWMAPEMMNGKVYDEKVDVFSFGVILCEIIGRVSADPDFLPRRSDFGLNESLFVEKFCRRALCPEPFYRVAFKACHLDPDMRPPFEVIEIWLESLLMDLSRRAPLGPLLADILSYRPRAASPEPDACCPRDACCRQDACCHCAGTRATGRCCEHAYRGDAAGGEGARVRRAPSSASEETPPGVEKSQSNTTIPPPAGARALGKCVSASQLCARPVVTLSSLSRSHNALANPGFILRAVGKSINITKVDDISEWLESPPPARRDLPAFLRNQSVEGLESKYKQDLDSTSAPCRHTSVHSPADSSSSSDEDIHGNWYNSVTNFKKMDADVTNFKKMDANVTNSKKMDADVTNFKKMDADVTNFKKMDADVTNFKKMDADVTDSKKMNADVNNSKKMDAGVTNYKNMDADATNFKKINADARVISNIIKKGENLLKKTSYDVTDVTMRNPDCYNERKFPEEDQRRFNIDYLKRTPILAEGLKHIPKTVDAQKEKTNFFSKKLLSPKLSRLFKPNTAVVLRNKVENDEKEEKSRSKFFIQRPISPNITRSYRVRPVDEAERKRNQDVLKSDIKLANMGKPMTPTFRRHLPGERPDFVDSRFSYRVSKSKFEPKTDPKFVDVGRNRIKAPLPIEKRIRTAQSQTTKATEDKPPRRREGISRSNYVSLANLKINSKGLDDKMEKKDLSPVERVI